MKGRGDITMYYTKKGIIGTILLTMMVFSHMLHVCAANDSHLTMSFSYNNLELYAIKEDGSLWACSVDEYTGERGEFEKIMDDAVSVSGNYAIKDDSSLWTWGYNLFTDEYEEEPIQVMEDVKEVSEKTSNSWHLLITKNDSSLWGIGSNYCGQLAQGQINEEVQLPWGPFYVPDNISEPVKIMDDVKKAEAGTSHSLILKTDGSIWTIGFGLVRGTGNIESSNIPAKVMNNAKNIFAGGLSSYVVADDGKDTVWRWGAFIPETSSTTDEESQMTPIKYISDVKKLTNLFGYVLAVKNDGSLWAYGKTEDVAKTPYDTEIYINETMNIIDDVDNVTGFAGPINIALVLKNNGELYLFELTGEEEQQYTLTKILDGVRLSDEVPEIHQKLVVSVSEIGINILLNDELVTFPDAQPFVDENDRTQIPIRVLAELLDFDVGWNGDTLTAELTKDDAVITIKIGESQITKNGEAIAIDTAARVINDRTYIPLRAVGEALGCEVEWDQN